jgi:hypothetical protein
MGARTIIGELAQVNGMKTPVRQAQNRLNHLFKKVETRVRKGKEPYHINDIKGMTKSLNTITATKDVLEILEGKTVQAPKEKHGMAEKLNKELQIAYNAMMRAHSIIEGIISDAEKETYFEMSENTNEIFDIMQKAEKPEVIMNVVRNFG